MSVIYDWRVDRVTRIRLITSCTKTRDKLDCWRGKAGSSEFHDVNNGEIAQFHCKRHSNSLRWHFRVKYEPAFIRWLCGDNIRLIHDEYESEAVSLTTALCSLHTIETAQ